MSTDINETGVKTFDTSEDQQNESKTEEGHDVSNDELCITNIQEKYPPSCLPSKLSTPTGSKAKELKFESIDPNTYDEEANMVAFRIGANRLAPWIRALQIIYCDEYGKSDSCKIEWYDDPINWPNKSAGRKSICIDVKTNEYILMYKITLFINTGVFQVQGSQKGKFVSKEFKRLKSLVERVIVFNKLNNIMSGNKNSANRQVVPEVNHNKLDQGDDQTYDQGDLDVTNQKDINDNETAPNKNSGSIEGHLNKHISTESNVSVFDQNKGANNLLSEMFSRMEKSFTVALETVSTQQTNMFQSKLESMEKMYMKSLDSHETKFSEILNKFDSMSNKCATLNKENGELKCKLGNLNHTTALEKEVMRHDLETKINAIQQQNNVKNDSIAKFSMEIDKLSEQISVQSEKMLSLEKSHMELNAQLAAKEQEVLSLKLHESRDDSMPFQQVPVGQRQNQQDMRRTKELITIIGTSNTEKIDPQKMSTHYDVNKITAMTLEDTKTAIKSLNATPDVLLLHSITNDIKLHSAETCVSKLTEVVNTAAHHYPRTKIIVSLPTPRSDKSSWNLNSQLISVMLKEKYNDEAMITLCDNSNLSYKGEPISRHFLSDGLHLSNSGAAILASNMRDCIDKILGLPRRQMNAPGRGRQNYRGRGNHRGGRGRFMRPLYP